MAESFGAIPRPQRTLEKTYTVEPAQDGERFVSLRRVGDNQNIMAVYHIPAASHPDTAALRVLATVWATRLPAGSTRPWWITRRRSAPPWEWKSSTTPASFSASALTLRGPVARRGAGRSCSKTIEGFVNEPPPKEEVERAKTRILKQIELK